MRFSAVLFFFIEKKRTKRKTLWKSWVFRACELDQGRCPLDPCELLKKLDQNFIDGKVQF